ncbi:MAG TPA: diacylglycerol kinase family lipid kinase [Bacillota bacterium]|nr:diacylglycerol kinase family lipid kinase [Bacillota bacterium]
MGKIRIVLNMKAGRGKSGKVLPELAKHMQELGLSFDLQVTQKQGHAVELARQARLDGVDLVIAAGGDGTYHEVMNGLTEGGKLPCPATAMGVVTTGSGCDFPRSINMPRDDWKAAAQVIRQGKLKQVDIVKATYIGPYGAMESKAFINASNAGLTSETILSAESFKILGGKAGYLLAGIKTLLAYKNREIRLVVDGEEAFRGKATMVTVGNGTYCGGGIMFTPSADPFDGMIDAVVIGDLNIWEVLKEIPRIYSGGHLANPKVKAYRGKTMRLESKLPLYAEMDGEMPGTLPVEYEVLPGALKLLVP